MVSRREVVSILFASAASLTLFFGVGYLFAGELVLPSGYLLATAFWLLGSLDLHFREDE
jgi:hypothetical protein